SSVIEQNLGDDSLWHYRRAVGHLRQNQIWIKSGQVKDALDECELAADDMATVIRLSPLSIRRIRIDESRVLHDFIWELSGGRKSLKDLRDTFYLAKRFVERQDHRAVNYFRMLETCENYVDGIKTIKSGSSYEENIKEMIYHLRNAQEARNKHDNTDTANVTAFTKRIDEIISKLNKKRLAE
ncbi:MAG: hypothetical protein ACREHG_06305, partial [Candidatus Saccharimonadales bacterium]